MVELNSGTAITGGSAVGAEHFGLNYLVHLDGGIEQTAVFTNIANSLNETSSVRFPGGTVAEVGAGGAPALDISVTNGVLAGTTLDFLDNAAANNWSVSFVLPMWRFLTVTITDVNDVPTPTLTINSADATQEIGDYVEAVIAAAADKGITIDGFELGNEWDVLTGRALTDWYDLDDVATADRALITPEFAEPFSMAYAELAAALAVAVQSEIDSSPHYTETTEPFIAIQALRAWMDEDSQYAIDYGTALETFFPDGTAANAVDAVISHFYLGQPGDGATVHDPSWANHFTNMEHVSDIFGSDLDYLVSEWNIQDSASGTLENNGADGIQQLEPIVGIFHTMISQGVDHANFWAVRQSSWNSLFGTGIVPETVQPSHDRPVRYLFDLLSDQLIGTEAIDLNGEGNHGSMQTIGDNIHVYGFEDENSTILYLGSRSAGTQNINLDLANYTTSPNSTLVQLTHISVDDPSLPSWEQTTTIETEEYTFSQFQAQSGDFLTFSAYELISIEIIYDVGLGETQTGTGIQDVMFGTAADDIFIGSIAADEIFGYSGTDTVDYSDSDAAVHVFLNTYYGVNAGGHAGGDTLFSIANVTGSEHSDQIEGDGDANVLRGMAGDDLLLGRWGNDTIIGGAGDDQMYGNEGDDFISGWAGNDTLSGGDGTDTLIGGAGNDTLTGGTSTSDLRDMIYGGAGNDTIYGGYGNDELRGDAGDDTITGGFGADMVIGGADDDVLTGAAFSDELFGGDGMDFINGGYGHDRLNGGAGADRFYHIGVSGHGTDWVQDFSAAEGDTLEFGIGTATGADFRVTFAHTENAAGERSGDDAVQEAFVIYNPTGQVMWALVDGGGQASIDIVIGGVTYDLLG